MTEIATLPMPLAPGTWSIDPDHSSVHFKIRHLGLSHVHGRFNQFDATLTVGEDLASTRVDATIDIASIDTNQPERDAHLRSTPFFSSETHPEMTLRGATVRARGHQTVEVEGGLTINGITRPVILSVEIQGTGISPTDGRERAGFGALFEIDREEYGVDFPMPRTMEGVAVGKAVLVELEVQFVASGPAASR